MGLICCCFSVLKQLPQPACFCWTVSHSVLSSQARNPIYLKISCYGYPMFTQLSSAARKLSSESQLWPYTVHLLPITVVSLPSIYHYYSMFSPQLNPTSVTMSMDWPKADELCLLWSINIALSLIIAVGWVLELNYDLTSNIQQFVHIQMNNLSLSVASDFYYIN